MMYARGRARAFALLVAAAFVALVTLVRTSRAANVAPNCFESISQANAQQLYDALLKARPADGCALEDVQTATSTIRIVWKKGGDLQEAVLLVPTSCAVAPNVRGQVLSSLVPASVADACPAAVGGLNALITSDAFGGLAADPKGSVVPLKVPTNWRRLGFRIGAGVLALVVIGGGAFVLVRRRRARRATATEPAAKAEEKPTEEPRSA